VAQPASVTITGDGGLLFVYGEPANGRAYLMAYGRWGNIEFWDSLGSYDAGTWIVGSPNALGVVDAAGNPFGLAEMDGGYPGYRISKAGLNAVTRYLSHELPEARVNSVCPGWVRTDMGGPGAARSIDEGVASILWAALLPAGGPTGGFFRDGKPLSW